MHARRRATARAGPTAFHVSGKAGRLFPERGGRARAGLEHGGAHTSERASRCLSRAAGEGGEALRWQRVGAGPGARTCLPVHHRVWGLHLEAHLSFQKLQGSFNLSALDPPAGEHPPLSLPREIQSSQPALWLADLGRAVDI